MKRNIIKVITLISFISLITAFVIYRSGYFDQQNSNYPTSTNSTNLNKQANTILKVDSLKKINLMSSSKVLILKEHSIQLKDFNESTFDSSSNVNHLIHSSKSGVIIKSDDLKKFMLDSILKDSLKK